MLWSRVKTVVKAAFGPRFLLPTNIALCVSLSGLGDAMQQHVRVARGVSKTYNARRTKNMALSAVTMGVICHYWYIWLDRVLVGTTIRVVLLKVFWDQILLSPVMWLVYVASLGSLEQSGMDKMRERLVKSAGHIYVAEWIVWPPAQMVNFYFLPTKFRVLYDNIISLGFDWYSSYILHDHED